MYGQRRAEKTPGPVARAVVPILAELMGGYMGGRGFLAGGVTQPSPLTPAAKVDMSARPLPLGPTRAPRVRPLLQPAEPRAPGGGTGC